MNRFFKSKNEKVLDRFFKSKKVIPESHYLFLWKEFKYKIENILDDIGL